MRGYIQNVYNSLQMDYTEGTFYSHIQSLFNREFVNANGVELGLNHYSIEAQPSQDGRFPDFAIWDEENELITRIEAKRPEISLSVCLEENQNQLINYLNEATGHPNLILTNFLSFAFVRLEAGEAVFDGDIYFIAQSLEDLSNNPAQNLVAQAATEFRNLLTIIASLEASEVNSVSTTMNYMILLSHAVEDIFNQNEITMPGVTEEHNNVLQANLNNLHTLTQPFIQEDGRSFGQLLILGLSMNEFLRRRRENDFDYQIEEGILPQMGLRQAINNLFTWREMFQINTLFERVMYGLSLHFPNILPGDNIDILENNRILFEQFVFGYLENEDSNWVNDFGTVPTPYPIIRYMIRKAEQEWSRTRDNNDGLLDSECFVLDPCTGSGHYYISVLEHIYRKAVTSGLGIEYAREQVRIAIGSEEQRGRIVAIDIQPACLLMTLMNLRLFCEQYQINTEFMLPSVHLANSLTVGDEIGPQYLFDLANTDFSITLGNPPWSGHSSFQMEGLAATMTPWSGAYADWYTQNINRKVRASNPNPAFAFLQRYVTVHHSDIVSFVIPSTICYSAQWMGARSFFRENGFRVRIDHLGGEIGAISREDGDSVFVIEGVPTTTTACSIITICRPDSIDSEPDIRARVCWSNPGRWSTEQKLLALSNEAPLVGTFDGHEFLPAEETYTYNYSLPAPPHHYWAPSADGFDGIPLGFLSVYDRNYNGMEPTTGMGYRLVDANQTAFTERIRAFFLNENLQHAIDGDGGTWYSENFNPNAPLTSEVRFDLISDNIEQISDSFRCVSMGCMVNTFAFTPVHLNDAGADRVNLWHRMKVHQYTLQEDSDDDEIAEGYFLIPQTLGNQSDNGILGSHIPFYPGHKDTAKRNGRAFPRMYFDGENWVANIRDDFRDFLESTCADWDCYTSWNENEPVLAEEIWDYILGIYSSSQMRNSMQHPNTCYLTNLIFPANEELFDQIRSLGEYVRLLQSFNHPPENSIYRSFHNELVNVVAQNLSLRNSRDYEHSEPVGLNLFEVYGQKTDRNYTPSFQSDEGGIIDDNSIQELLNQFQNLVNLLGMEGINTPAELTELSIVRINSQGGDVSEQWLHGVPTTAVNLRIGGHPVLARWLTWNSNSGGRLHSTWDDEHREQKYPELITVIRNLTSLAIIQPIANGLFDRVVSNLSSWHLFQNSEEE